MSRQEQKLQNIPGPLTSRHREVLDFIEEYVADKGHAPLIEEIRVAVGRRSRSTVHEHLRTLENRGYISRKTRVPRGISLVEYPPPSHDLELGEALQVGKRAVERAGTLHEASWALEFSEILYSTQARGAVLHLVNEVGELEPRLSPFLWLGHWRRTKIPRSFGLGEGIAGQVWETKQSYVSSGNVREDPRYLPSGLLSSKYVRSLMAVPMLDARKRCLGVLSLDSNPEDWFQKRFGERIQKLELSSNQVLQAITAVSSVSSKDSVDLFLLGFREAIS